MPKPGEGTLLVEVKAAGINYADVLARSGVYPTIRQAPFVLGFEVADVVRRGVGWDSVSRRSGVSGFGWLLAA